jgi:hypothetical protein
VIIQKWIGDCIGDPKTRNTLNSHAEKENHCIRLTHVVQKANAFPPRAYRTRTSYTVVRYTKQAMDVIREGTIR